MLCQVGQAQSDSSEAKKQVTKAKEEVQAIIDELKSLQDINESDLDSLGKHIILLSFIYSFFNS